MSLTETDIECVVSKIFENLNQNDGTISTMLVIELVSSYVSRDRPEFSSLKESILYNSNDGNIGQSNLKFALCKWAENLKTVNEISNMEDVSEYNIDSKNDYTSFSSISSHGYREHIEELNNDIANKKRIISKLRKQIDAITRQHEDSHSVISKERDMLLQKFINEQNHNSALRNVKNDYEEAVETLQNTKQHVSTLKNDMEKSKKENHRLLDFIATLNEEKQKLMSQIACLEREKAGLINKIEGIDCCNKLLQYENNKLTDEISEQKIKIEALVRAKKSIQEELENYIVNVESLQCKNKNKIQNLSEESAVNVYNENCDVGTKLNWDEGVSLMQELSQLSDSVFADEKTDGKNSDTYTIDGNNDNLSMDLYLNELPNSRVDLQGMHEHEQLLVALFQLSEQRARESRVEMEKLRSHQAEWGSMTRWREKKTQVRTSKRSSFCWGTVSCVIFAVILLFLSSEYFKRTILDKYASSTYKLRFEGRPPF